MKPIGVCRAWLFLPGADKDVLMAAPGSGADVLIQELEDFTPPELRPDAGDTTGLFPGPVNVR